LFFKTVLETLFNHINNISPLSEEAQHALSADFRKVEKQKGEFLLKEGSICKNLYFLERGCLRGFYLLEEKEITHWFAFENDFVTSFHSFITRKASLENIQLLEGSVLWSISHDALYALYDRFPEIERLGRISCEKYYIRLEERYVNSQFKTAGERYLDLINSNPLMLQRVSLGYVASFLAISQETLSRIRSKKP